jgi:tRNA U34 5-methylaminomethyl-2-thiouridine-forming methyltransferase MnmC
LAAVPKSNNSDAAVTFAFATASSQNHVVAAAEYQLVSLRNGTSAVYVASYDEKMHPGLGPAAEAEALYIQQLRIRERMQQHTGEFVIWDVGLGAAANALTLLRLTRDLPIPLRIVSFDNTRGPLEFALAHAPQLGYFDVYETPTRELLERNHVEFRDGARAMRWDFVLGDFPGWCAQALTRHSLQQHEVGSDAPHAIFYDAFSPAKNPAMWTLPLFMNLFSLLDPVRPCSLTTYSRSTMLRVTLLLAGFYVGQGRATGFKEETTVAANTLKLIEQPLERSWLERAKRSGSAEPLNGDKYRQQPLSSENLARLEAHPQFR